MRNFRLRQVIVAAFFLTCLAQDKPGGPSILSLDEVVKMVRAGVTQELVIARIKRFNKPFDLNSDEIVELKSKGVSDDVIAYLLDPSKPYTPPPPPAPATPDAKPPAPTAPPKDPIVLKLPPEPGMYWLESAELGKESFQLTDLKPIVSMGAGGMMTKLTGGLKKGRATGFIVEPVAKVRVRPGTSVFYGRLGGKPGIEDLVLLQTEVAGNKRTLDFGPKPEKPVFSPAIIHAFSPDDVGSGIYRLDVSPLKPGEYVFFILGSGDQKKGILGKGYEFGVDPPHKQ
jgi:hypothetical protein